MKLAGFALLADENIDPEVVAYLRGLGCDVADVAERRWHAREDVALLDAAFAEQRVILTYDADFGRLAVVGRRDLIGLIYLRPGHIDAAFTIGTLEALIAQDLELDPPFIPIAKRTGDRVTVRLRPLEPN